jgi:hypothetical protein
LFTSIWYNNIIDEKRQEFKMMQGSNAVPFIDFNKKYKVTSVMKNNFTVTPPPVYAKGEHLKTVQYAYQHAQGGCYAKGFLYTCMHCPFVQPNKCIIIKQDIKTGKIVGISREYEFGHANDATFNPDNNTIVIAYCDGTTRLAILDADTLEYTKTVTLEGRELINIHYDPQAKVYVACAFQNEIFYVYDKDFKLTNSFKGFMSPGPVREYSLQGCITDGVYVYVLEWHGGQVWGELKGQGGATHETSSSHFNIFDIKTGEHVAVIDTGIPREIEYAAYVDGKFYIGSNNIHWNGLEVWEMTVSYI